MNCAEWCKTTLKENLRSYQNDYINSNKKINLGHWGRRTGKSFINTRIALYEAIVNNKSVGVFFPYNSMKKEFYKDIKAIIKEFNFKCKIYSDSIEFDNEGKILLVTTNTNSVCGISLHIAILEEAEFIKKEYVSNIIIPIITTIQEYKIYGLSSKNSNMTNNFHRLLNTDCTYSKISSNNKENTTWNNSVLKHISDDCKKYEFMIED